MDSTVTFRGNLVANPTYRVTAGGLHMTRFRLAQNDRRYDRATGEFVNTEATYMTVVCWRQLADNVANTLRKGDGAVVYGRLRMHEYDDPQSGVRRQSYEIDAASVGPDLARCSATLIRTPRDMEPPAATEPADPVTGATTGAEAGATTGDVPAGDVPGQPTNPWTEPEPVPVNAESAA